MGEEAFDDDRDKVATVPDEGPNGVAADVEGGSQQRADYRRFS